MEIVLDLRISVNITAPEGMSKEEAIAWARDNWETHGSVWGERVEDVTIREVL